MARTSKRVNITIPEEVHKLLSAAAEQHYGGNLSRFLADAGVYYAGVIKGRVEASSCKREL